MNRVVIPFALLLWSATAHAQQVLHHDLDVTLDPAQNSIAVIDTITLVPQSAGQREFTFSLNERLLIASLQGDNYRIEEVTASLGNSAADAGREIAPSKQYRLILTDDSTQVTLNYEGQVYTDAEQLTAEYAQSFSSTTGIIGEQGVYLDHSSVWVPDFQVGLMNFAMAVDFAPTAEGWTSVSQGDSQGRENYWVSEQPM
ncbi:MAG: hypothetical protein WBJ75_04165, partial [Pseudohongiellaceae bacterium]